jgi:hypothetical protein
MPKTKFIAIDMVPRGCHAVISQGKVVSCGVIAPITGPVDTIVMHPADLERFRTWQQRLREGVEIAPAVILLV